MEITDKTLSETQIKNFMYKEALEFINEQIKFFRTLNLPLSNKNILEIGCGPVGKYTEFLLENKNKVTSLDIRVEHLLSIKNKFNDVEILEGDMNKKCLKEKYDVCFSTGNLYHLSEPSKCIEHIAEHCKEYFILSTCVTNEPDGIIFLQEPQTDLAQAYNGIGCRFSRLWVYKELKKHFKYVLTPYKQPNYIEFIEDWDTNIKYNHALRAIFIATNDKDMFDQQLFSEDLLINQKKIM